MGGFEDHKTLMQDWTTEKREKIRSSLIRSNTWDGQAAEKPDREKNLECQQ